MTDHVTMSMEEFAAFLDGVTTTVICHPSREDRVRGLLIAGVTSGAYRITTDETYPPDRVQLIRPQRTLDWFP